MVQPTPEQMADFGKYLRDNDGEPITSETWRQVVEDDLAEAKKQEAARVDHNRHYNAKKIEPPGQPKTLTPDT